MKPPRQHALPVERNWAASDYGRLRIAVLGMIFCAIVIASPEKVFAQAPPAAPAAVPPAEPDGVIRGGYQIHSSVELGYRSTDVIGSGDMYDTLVNLQTGPRILDQSLTMQSVDHQGLLFDNLYLNSAGWGGDPNNYARLRADKNKWYNLQSSFRRDRNFFDYNLLANPLNPPTSTPSVPVQNSPHSFDTTRRMSDVDLTLLPQSSVSFRLGYSHNNMTGPSYSSIHEGTEASLLQNWNTTMNSYRVGVDFRIAPRTVLSYDQFLDYYKGDTDYQLNPINEAFLPTTPTGSVSLGLSFDTANKTPCAVVPPAASLIVNGTLTNVTCSAYSSYLRNQQIRTSTPTERISLRSSYFQMLEVLGSFSYSSATSSTPLDESFVGLITRTGTLAFNGAGTAAANRIADVADFEATLHLTQHLRLIEKFYFWAYRIPENGNFSEVDNNCPTTTPPCTLLTPLSATIPTTTPTITQSSFNQTWTRNQTELAWDFSKKAGARIGYRYGDRDFNHFNDYLPGDGDHFVGLEKTALLGLWARPIHALRLNFDLAAHKFQWRVRSHIATQRSAIPIPDDLYAALMGNSGRVDQHSATVQRRRADPVSGTQPKLWADRVSRAAGKLRNGFGVQLQQRNPKCPDLLQRHAASRGDPSLCGQCE